MNHQIFERMLCFRVLLEACLFECLFSPLAFSSLVEDGADFGVSGRLPFLRRELTPSAQVERRRDRFTVRGREHALNANLNQRGATQVKTMFGKRDLAEQSVNLQKHYLRIVRPSRAIFFN